MTLRAFIVVSNNFNIIQLIVSFFIFSINDNVFSKKRLSIGIMLLQAHFNLSHQIVIE